MGDGVVDVGGVFKLQTLETTPVVDGVLGVGDQAFMSCDNLEEVILPSGLKTLDYAAFKNCTALKRIELPTTLETISIELFMGCVSLSEVHLPTAAYRDYSNAVRGFKFYAAAGGELFLRPMLFNGRTKKKGTVSTAVKLAVKGENLEISYRCEEPRIKDIVAVKRKQDDGEMWKDNGVEFVGIPAHTTRPSQMVNHFMREVAGVWHYILLGGQYSD